MSLAATLWIVLLYAVVVIGTQTPTKIEYVAEEIENSKASVDIPEKSYQRGRSGPRVRYRGIGGVVDAATGGLQNLLGTVSDANDDGLFGFRGGVGNIIGSVLRLMNAGIDMASVVVHSILNGRDLFASRGTNDPFNYDVPFE